MCAQNEVFLAAGDAIRDTVSPNVETISFPGSAWERVMRGSASQNDASPRLGCARQSLAVGRSQAEPGNEAGFRSVGNILLASRERERLEQDALSAIYSRSLTLPAGHERLFLLNLFEDDDVLPRQHVQR